MKVQLKCTSSDSLKPLFFVAFQAKDTFYQMIFEDWTCDFSWGILVSVFFKILLATLKIFIFQFYFSFGEDFQEKEGINYG